MRNLFLVSLLLASCPLATAASLTPASRLQMTRLASPDVAAALRREQAVPAGTPRPTLWALPVSDPLPTLADGEWETVDGTAVWRLPLEATGAQSIGIAFSDLRLPDDAQLSVSSLDATQTRGPYTQADVRNGKLQLPIIEGEQLLLTVEVPVARRESLSLTIARLDYGFRNFDEADVAYKSGGCNEDVACSAGDPVRDQIRAVALYTVAQPDRSYTCSGTLLNNTAQNGRPYFLTADHCFRNNSGAFVGDPDSIVLYWNYQASSCGGPRDGNTSQSQSGTTLRANNLNSDFVLLELDQRPPSAYKVYYAGWDRSNAAPTSAIGIHHPQGDEKAISVEYDATTITDYGSDTTDTSANYIRIGNWDIGVTEGGSSGSALFNPDHRLVGTLTGGAAQCNNLGTNDNNQPDWYGRFYEHWSGSTADSGSVRSWLDPEGRGDIRLSGIDAADIGADDSDDGDGGSLPALLLLFGGAAVLRCRYRRSV